jgi:hypothetical protein
MCRLIDMVSTSLVAVLLVMAAQGLSSAAESPSLIAPPIATGTAPEKVAVLDGGGDLISLEAHQATVAEVIEVLKTRLNLAFSNTDRIDMTRIVDGTRVGNIQHILSWLVPSGGFVVYYQEQKTASRSNPGRPERVGFLDGGPATAGAPSALAQDPSKQTAAGSQNAAKPGPNGASAPASAGSNPNSGKGDTTGKPNVADTGGIHQLLTVPEQLRAATVDAQLEIDRQQHDPTGQAPAPAFLNGPNNVAGTTLQQQMQRSQALATSQIQALQQALSAACRGAPGAPC